MACEKRRSRPERVTPTPAASRREDLGSWRIVRASGGGQAIAHRLRRSRPARADVGTLTTAVASTWPCPGGSMPDEETQRLHDGFEDAIDPITSGNDNSALVQVTTGMGAREWLCYVRSRDLFLERFNREISGHEPCPLTIELHDDPGRRLWAKTIADLGPENGGRPSRTRRRSPARPRAGSARRGPR